MKTAHFLALWAHHGKAAFVLINQCCGLIVVIWLAYLLYKLFSGTVSETDFPFPLAAAFTHLMVICMESRICKYKQIRFANRENGTWNDEKRKEAKELFKI